MDWALILQFRSAVLCIIFQVNGAYDVGFAVFAPMIVIFASSFKVPLPPLQIGLMAFYIVMCFFGMSSLCYVVARDVKILFLLEKSEGERGDQLSGLLDLFDGGVLIIDEKSHEVVYQNNQLTVRQFDLFD